MNITQKIHGLKTIFVMMGAFACCAALALSCTGCSSTGGASGEKAYTPDEAIAELNSASEIVVDKDLINFGDHWAVYADGQHVADITGEFIKIWDVYVMRSTDGQFMCAEEENIRLITARSTKVDEQGTEIGYYNQKFDFLFMRMEAVNAAGEVIGNLDQNINIVLDCDITDSAGDKAWHAKKDLISLGAKIRITKDSGNVPVEDAIMMSVIANEIVEASQNR